MSKRIALTVLSLLWVCGAASGADKQPAKADTNDGFQREFKVDPKQFSSTGKNDYFILEPGYQLTLAGEDGKLVVTVLDKTETIDGVETRIVEERETSGDKLVEVSRNFFAINKQDGGVYYFGEDTDSYKDGKLDKHDGWRSGEKKAHFGLFMPGRPKVGDKFYMEVAPGDAMDRAEIVAVDATVTTPAGEYKNCIKFAESTPLEADEHGVKLFASGVGLVQDDGLKLVMHGKK